MENGKTTIRFHTRVSKSIAMPCDANAELPGADAMVEGTINGFPFRAAMKVIGGTATLAISRELILAADAEADEAVPIELTRVDDEPETRAPMELRNALAASADATETWKATTPIARRDWVLWICSTKSEATRLKRIEKAVSMLASGKRRVCCFAGLNWLLKDHPNVDTWLPLPGSKRTSR